jgi:Ca2+-binding RTX toxin-like protein
VTVSGGSGADRLTVDTNFLSFDVRVNGESGSDELFLANGLGTQHAALSGGEGADLITVRNQRAVRLTLDGGTGNDSTDVRGASLDVLFAALGDGDDTLSVSASVVALETDLDGGLGSDRLAESGNLFKTASRNRGFEIR